jgi:hypothetical protein
MNHLVLLGDSIFDNAAYVQGGPSVIEHVRRALPADWKATLLARDGAMTGGVVEQLIRLPADTTQLIVSAGGNDALEHAGMILHEQANSFADAMSRLAAIQKRFDQNYRDMLDAVAAKSKPTMVCTIYDAIPGLEPSLVAALSLFNDVIARRAIRMRLPLIDLRQFCTEATDFAGIWPIEPSQSGGAKIGRAIARAATTPTSEWDGCKVLSP